MKVVDVAVESAEILGQNDVVEALEKYIDEAEAGETPSEFAPETDLKIRKLISAIRLVVERIASEHVAMTHTEDVVADSRSEIDLSGLTYSAHEVLKLVDSVNEEPVSFQSGLSHLVVPVANRRYRIEYRFRPTDPKNLGDVLLLPIFVTRRAVCFGVVSDILLARNVVEESRIWNDKFVDSIKLVQRMVRERKF